MSEEEIIKEIENIKLDYRLYNPIDTKELDAIDCLLYLYNKEKEKNKELENKLKSFKHLGMVEMIDKYFIDKDKIREKMEKLNKEIKNAEVTEAIFKIKQQQILQELLEERN